MILLRSRTPATDHVWEGIGANIDVDVLTTVGGQSSTIADITVVTLPGFGISVFVWSKEDVTILGQTDWSIPSRALEVRILAVSDFRPGEFCSCFEIDAGLSVSTKGRAFRGAVKTVSSLGARSPIMVMELVVRGWVIEADRESLDFVDDGIDVTASEGIEDVATRQGNTRGSVVVIGTTVFLARFASEVDFSRHVVGNGSADVTENLISRF